MTDGRWQMEKKLIYVRKGDIFDATTALVEGAGPSCYYLETVVIGSLIVEWTYPNGTSTHTWGTKPVYLSPSHPLQIPHIFMSYIMW